MTTEPTLAGWDRDFALRLVSSVNTLRDSSGISIPKLRDKLAKAGWSMSVETLNGILSSRKRRSFTIGEVFCFAKVLNVPPEFLILGLPAMDALPGAPLIERTSVPDALRWLRGTEDSVFVGSPLQWLERYSRLMAELRRENAIWKVTGQERMTDQVHGPHRYEVRVIDDLLDRIATTLAGWSASRELGERAPDLPFVHPALSPFVGTGSYPSAPIEDLVDSETLLTVQNDLERMWAAQAEVDRMKAAEFERSIQRTEEIMKRARALDEALSSFRPVETRDGDGQAADPAE